MRNRILPRASNALSKKVRIPKKKKPTPPKVNATPNSTLNINYHVQIPHICKYIYIYAYKIRKAIDNLLVKENIVHKEIHFYNIKK